jgi:hypothetical protein
MMRIRPDLDLVSQNCLNPSIFIFCRVVDYNLLCNLHIFICKLVAILRDPLLFYPRAIGTVPVPRVVDQFPDPHGSALNLVAGFDPDPGEQKSPTNIEKSKELHVLKCWMISLRAEGSPVACASFIEAQG